MQLPHPLPGPGAGGVILLPGGCWGGRAPRGSACLRGCTVACRPSHAASPARRRQMRFPRDLTLTAAFPPPPPVELRNILQWNHVLPSHRGAGYVCSGHDRGRSPEFACLGSRAPVHNPPLPPPLLPSPRPCPASTCSSASQPASPALAQSLPSSCARRHCGHWPLHVEAPQLHGR